MFTDVLLSSMIVERANENKPQEINDHERDGVGVGTRTIRTLASLARSFGCLSASVDRLIQFKFIELKEFKSTPYPDSLKTEEYKSVILHFFCFLILWHKKRSLNYT